MFLSPDSLNDKPRKKFLYDQIFRSFNIIQCRLLSLKKFGGRKGWQSLSGCFRTRRERVYVLPYIMKIAAADPGGGGREGAAGVARVWAARLPVRARQVVRSTITCCVFHFIPSIWGKLVGLGPEQFYKPKPRNDKNIFFCSKYIFFGLFITLLIFQTIHFLSAYEIKVTLF